MLRHYAGHYYLFWGVVSSALVLCLLAVLREVRLLRLSAFCGQASKPDKP